MEIHSLKLLATEADINNGAEKALPREGPVRQVTIQLTPEGVVVKGVYNLIVGVPFETRWEVSVREGKVAARLASVKVVGFGAGMLNSLLMGAVVEAARKEDALQVEGDTVLVDVDRLLAKHGLLARTNLTALRCEQGRLWVEASG